MKNPLSSALRELVVPPLEPVLVVEVGPVVSVPEVLTVSVEVTVSLLRQPKITRASRAIARRFISLYGGLLGHLEMVLNDGQRPGHPVLQIGILSLFRFLLKLCDVLLVVLDH